MQISPEEFRRRLLLWAKTINRPMPWRGETDAYRIWLSEVMLQQTRVEQGTPYYLKFIERFPAVTDLAAATEEEVFKLWQGLGYYSRARNMQTAARKIAEEYGGKFPAEYKAIRALPGVGDYTASAVASFAYGLPYAVVDGNVYRVLARIFGYELPTNTPSAKKHFAEMALDLLDKDRPGEYNQAIMDFGAVHCTPKRPKCMACPFSADCVAYQEKKVALLPVKGKSLVRKTRYFVYAVFNSDGEVLVRQRQESDIWQGLFDFPLLEMQESPGDWGEAAELVLQHFLGEEGSTNVEILSVSPSYKQQLSHQEIFAIFVEIRLENPLFDHFFKRNEQLGWRKTVRYDIKKNIALPRIIDQYLSEKPLTLTLV